MRTLQSAGGAVAPELGPWFHNLHLPGGRRTAPDHPLGDFPAFKWNEIAPHLPADLRGARALDIGCNAGFYSFELARRGAHVLAVDIDEHYLRQAHWAARELGLSERVELRRAGVYELATLNAEPFDVVLFLGVLYHMRHPMLALERVASVTRELLIVETLVDCLGYRRPAMAFYPGSELSRDDTNWCGPNPAAVVAMLKTVGFPRVDVVAGARSLPFRAAKAGYYRARHGYPMLAMLRTDRAVFHARRT